MVKKILSLAVAIMLLSVTALANLTIVQAASTGETKTYGPIYNTVDGTTANATGNGTFAHKDEIYESVKFYDREVPTAVGVNSNANESDRVGSSIAVGYDTNGDWASFLRFPLSNLNIPANEVVTKAELALVTKYGSTHTGSWTLNAYGGFTDVAFGQELTFNKTFSELTASDKIVGTTPTTPLVLDAAAQFTPVSIDVTDYVAGLLASDAVSADICLAAPGASAKLELCSGSMKSNSGANYKPRLIITTMVDPNYGIPAIDTVANEGKTKIRMQTTDTAFSNTSCGLVADNKTTITYNVNAKTAGKYYFSVYTASNQFNNAGDGVSTKPSSLTVNDTKLDASDSIFKVSTCKAEPAILTDPTVTPDYLYHNIYEIDLIRGNNTIAVYKGTSSQFGIAYVELTNYPRTAATNTKAIAEKGIEIPATVQPINVVKPTVVYKVYDSIAAANVARGNVVMQLAGGTESHADDCYYIAASYDSNNKLQDVELLSFPHYRWTTRTVDFGEFSLEGISYIKVFAFDGTPLAPVANFGAID